MRWLRRFWGRWVGWVVVGGVMTVVVVGWAAWLWPQVRRFGSLRDARPLEEEEPRGFEVLPAKAAGDAA